MVKHLLACGNEILINPIMSILNGEVKRSIAKLPEKTNLKPMALPHHDSRSQMPDLLLRPKNNANHLTHPRHIHEMIVTLEKKEI
jgi:hypothetical protein